MKTERRKCEIDFQEGNIVKNNVQAYIAVVSFPTSIEELRYFTDNDYYMDMEEIMLGHDVNYTAPKWAAKGDIIFFYHAKSAIVKIRSLKKQVVGQKDEDKLMEYLDLAEKIYKACGESIFCVARVGDNPEIIKDDRENLHWRGDVYAKVSDYALLKNPVSKNVFEQYIKLAQQRTITPVLGEDFENLKNLILKDNDVPYLKTAHAVPVPLKDISPKNWLSVSYDYRRRFYLEMQFRKFYADYFLKALGDRRSLFSECVCYKNGKRSGYADNCILFHGKYISVEIKLNINTEKDLSGQLEKYCHTERIKLSKDKEVGSDMVYQNNALVLDVNGLYIYDCELSNLRKIENLDNIKCEYDIRKLRETVKSVLEV